MLPLKDPSSAPPAELFRTPGIGRKELRSHPDFRCLVRRGCASGPKLLWLAGYPVPALHWQDVTLLCRHRCDFVKSLRDQAKTDPGLSSRRTCLLRHSVRSASLLRSNLACDTSLRDQAKTACLQSRHRFTVDAAALFATQRKIVRDCAGSVRQGLAKAEIQCPGADADVCLWQPFHRVMRLGSHGAFSCAVHTLPRLNPKKQAGL